VGIHVLRRMMCVICRRDVLARSARLLSTQSGRVVFAMTDIRQRFNSVAVTGASARTNRTAARPVGW